jgi:hypothetical protein
VCFLNHLENFIAQNADINPLIDTLKQVSITPKLVIRTNEGRLKMMNNHEEKANPTATIKKDRIKLIVFILLIFLVFTLMILYRPFFQAHSLPSLANVSILFCRNSLVLLFIWLKRPATFRTYSIAGLWVDHFL